jgi:hypothetical protein
LILSQEPKTKEQIQFIIDQIEFIDRKFGLISKGKDEQGNEFFLFQVQYYEEDIHTGKLELQKARKWYLSPYATETEIVETAFVACKRSMEHSLKEHFLYKGCRVYSPHFHIQGRIDMNISNKFDGRKPKDIHDTDLNLQEDLHDFDLPVRKK